MKRQEKAVVVEQLQADLAAMPNIFIAEYRGMTVEQMTELRNKVRKAAGAVQVVKNTFLRRAVAGRPQEPATGFCKGPNAVVLGPQDIVELAKIVVAADKDLQKFTLKGGVVEGRPVTPDEIRQIADLPPRVVLLGRAVGSLASPIRGLLTVCQGNTRQLVYALEAIRQAKEKSAA